MPHLNQKLKNLLSLIIGISVTAQTNSLPTDQQKLLELTAQEVQINQLAHRGYYYGNVQLDQGTSHLYAQRAVTYSDEHDQLILAIAYGTAKKNSQQKLAHYWTQTALDKPIMHA